MKRKIALGLCASLITLSLVGCSSSTEEKPEETSAPAVEETTAFTGEKTVETPYGEGNDKVVTTVTFEEGKPVDVVIDVKLEDGSTKREAVEAGTYVMAEESATWTEQIESLQAFIIENDFDLSKVILSDDEGRTDAVSGVTIKVSEYVSSVEEALSQVK